jgi:co-chaperonin GroES (HSP10)
MYRPLKGKLLIRLDPPKVRDESGIIIDENILRKFQTAYGGGEINDGTLEYAYEGCEIPVGAKIRFDHKVMKDAIDPSSPASGIFVEKDLIVLREDQLIYWYDGDYHMAPNRILGEPVYETEEELKEGGIYLKAGIKEKHQVSKVRAIGPNTELPDLKVGDLVLHSLKQRIRIECYHTTELWDLMRTRNIFGILPEMSDEEVTKRLADRKKFTEETEKLRPSVQNLTGRSFENEFIEESEKVWATKGRKIFIP